MRTFGLGFCLINALCAVDDLGNTAGDVALSLNDEVSYRIIRNAGLRSGGIYMAQILGRLYNWERTSQNISSSSFRPSLKPLTRLFEIVTQDHLELQNPSSNLSFGFPWMHTDRRYVLLYPAKQLLAS